MIPQIIDHVAVSAMILGVVVLLLWMGVLVDHIWKSMRSERATNRRG